MILRRYLLPAILVASMLVGFIVFVGKHRTPMKTGHVWPGSDLAKLPGGRVLYVVVDSDGYYVGDEFVSFLLLDKYLKEHAEELRPDYCIVCGTRSCRYGYVVEALDSLRGDFKVYSTVMPQAVPDGTRYRPIEHHENWWEYD